MSSILDGIQSKLEAIAKESEVPMQGVYYGTCQEQELPEWNYFVFNKKKTKKSSGKISYLTYYEIHIVHEDYIPEGYVEHVIEELTNHEDIILNVTDEDIIYDYIFKGNTNVVVEIATITVTRPVKG